MHELGQRPPKWRMRNILDDILYAGAIVGTIAILVGVNWAVSPLITTTFHELHAVVRELNGQCGPAGR